MIRRDMIALGDVKAALGLLTRLPVSVDFDTATARGAAAAWAYPIVGIMVALIAGCVGQITLWIGMPPVLAAPLVLATMIVTTGAMHEDGLADSADGLWGGWSVDHRLKIMKDSSTGAYGVLAIGLSLILRVVALALLIEAGWLWVALLASAALSRGAMVAAMHILPNARSGGLSSSVGRPHKSVALLAGLITLAVVLVTCGWTTLTLAIVCSIIGFACITIAKAKIGGQTGDIIGATGQMVEIAALLTLASVI